MHSKGVFTKPFKSPDSILHCRSIHHHRGGSDAPLLHQVQNGVIHRLAVAKIVAIDNDLHEVIRLLKVHSSNATELPLGCFLAAMNIAQARPASQLMCLQPFRNRFPFYARTSVCFGTRNGGQRSDRSHLLKKTNHIPEWPEATMQHNNRSEIQESKEQGDYTNSQRRSTCTGCFG